ncbi:MAG: ParB/RepB/Spo0J family partition protein [Faecalibacterium sp.]|nr:ParB/RepB/Spo0J family partition protein [Ruminococcus sp.]MCM1393183.1 ParB/RepB/Spo0J family partition protein [Ruminococcus sp.]MCM1486655.1 ParB/RepB/Spo0J family partition protein [Faecalibacterium sp.]
MNTIVNIPISYLTEHPENPRKNIGDVTELAASIKKSGIMQNLTVVTWAEAHPSEDAAEHKNRFTIIIGHRRFKAAKQAGLKELPCKIVRMDYKEQIATMLAENMQREDLTVSEEAFGMQMLLDLGESVEGISDRTGFSESTVRRRVKIAELGKDNVMQAEKKGATIAELVELAAIDEDERENVLPYIGTSNFKWACDRAKSNMKTKAKENTWREIFNSFADEVKECDAGFKTYLSENLYTAVPDDFAIPKDANEVKYTYAFKWSWVYLYREIAEEEKAEMDAEKERQAEKEHLKAARIKKLEEIDKQCENSRLDFVRSYHEKKGDLPIITAFYLTNLYSSCYYPELIDAIEYADIDVEIDENEDDSQFTEFIEKYPAKTMLAVCCHEIKGENVDCFNYYGEYSKCAKLEALYGLLVRLGYEPADEEKAYIDGSHEVYVKSEV